MSAAMHNAVRDNAARHRFELGLDGQTGGPVAFSNYKRDGNVVTILHTEVPEALNGRGIGSALVRGELDYARAQGWRVVPVCPFVKAWVGKHPEYADVLK